MCGDEYALAGEHLGANFVFEIRPGAGDRVLEALGIGQLIGCDVAVLLLGVGIARVVRLECRRADIEGAAPDEHLFVVADVEVEARFFEGSTACCGFFAARVGEFYVGPAGEQVEFVPLGFSVTDKDKLHCLSVCSVRHRGLLDLARCACRLLDAAKDTRFKLKS